MSYCFSTYAYTISPEQVKKEDKRLSTCRVGGEREKRERREREERGREGEKYKGTKGKERKNT